MVLRLAGLGGAGTGGGPPGDLLVHVRVRPDRVFRREGNDVHSEVPSLGASGAIAGALGAYVLLFPRGRVKVLLGFFVIPLPAFLVLGLWIFLQLFSGIGSIMSPADGGGVAYMAHIGGFAAGFILAFFLRRRRERVITGRSGWDRY